MISGEASPIVILEKLLVLFLFDIFEILDFRF
jgi:hypothetical protein